MRLIRGQQTQVRRFTLSGLESVNKTSWKHTQTKQTHKVWGNVTIINAELFPFNISAIPASVFAYSYMFYLSLVTVIIIKSLSDQWNYNRRSFTANSMLIRRVSNEKLMFDRSILKEMLITNSTILWCLLWQLHQTLHVLNYELFTWLPLLKRSI